ncbi:MAG TPA: heme-binding domain-containing protein [Terriglobales bacterium]|nr:heme-binding domain-containing protein [Terriglobales bacterium]
MRASKIILGVFVVLAAIQLYRPAKTNPPEDPSKTLPANSQMPPQVAQILDRSCSDCHTHKTVWPKYSYVAPMSWLVTDDVNEGRRHVNFSEWSSYSTQRRQAKLEDICNEVKDGGMPLKQYTWMHKGTALDQQQREAICAWTKTEQQRITAQTGVPVPQKKQGGMHAE